MDLTTWLKLILMIGLMVTLYPVWKRTVVETPNKTASEIPFTYVYWGMSVLIVIITIYVIYVAIF
ncbi:hypothetical protein AUQ39_04820 [Lacticaseibacillus casei]|nr:hypothetical protein AUQ39_04820 [Lacticaseibacillus casei]